MGSAVTKIPESVADLDIAWVAETLVKHGANVLAAAAELNVPAPDLRRLTLVKQELIDAALEAEEERLDLAEAVVDAALRSDSNRRKEAAAYFVLKNSVRSKKRGWIPSSSGGVEERANANSANAKHLVFHWADSDGSVRSPSTETIRRDGKDIEVPSYRPQAPDQIEGELAPAATGATRESG